MEELTNNIRDLHKKKFQDPQFGFLVMQTYQTYTETQIHQL
jgi:hypothetical protein